MNTLAIDMTQLGNAGPPESMIGLGAMGMSDFGAQSARRRIQRSDA
jgi:hypothetical protein